MPIDIDFLIINNCPSFYKINLYNELSKKCKIYVVFIALSNQVVIDFNSKNKIEFSYIILEEKHIDKRNKIHVFVKMLRIILKINFRFIIYGGYDLIELRLAFFFTNKNKNCLQSESSIKESRVTGIIAMVKKILIKRISIILPSGNLQSDVFKALNYKGKIIQTKGVGIFNKAEKIYVHRTKNFPLKYIYVGRLIDKKNIDILIKVFNENEKTLTIVGEGEKELELKKLAFKNIHFTGFIKNSKLGNVYNTHDVFILPSLIEPWGLVVEEAIYWGLPVIVSNAVGCQFEMVLKPNNGLVFELGQADSLKNAIKEIEANYELYQKNVSNFDFDIRDKEQVNAYLNILQL